MGESSANLDVYMRRMTRGQKKLLEYLFHMLQQRIPAGLTFRVTGEDGGAYFATVRNANDIADDYDFEISPNSANSNKAIQEEVAMQILQLTSNPLDIQLGVITMNERYNAIKNVLKTKGVKDFGQYCKKPQGYMLALTPEEEANRILAGYKVQVTPEMDHQGFINFFQMALETDEILGQFSEEQTLLLAQQSKQHEQMMQALAEMQAQQANANQMRQNAAMSQQQAPQGMSAMEGAGAAAPAA
jgi:hypothetical protein